MFFFSNVVLAMETGCDLRGKEGVRHELISDLYDTKIDEKPIQKKTFFGSGTSLLYCLNEGIYKKCSEKSTWYNLERFISFLAKNKSVICAYERNTTIFRSGVKKLDKRVVYYTAK